MPNQCRKYLILGGLEALTQRIQRFQVLQQGVPTGTRMGRQPKSALYKDLRLTFEDAKSHIFVSICTLDLTQLRRSNNDFIIF
jgi:hypothetical protein